MTTKDKTCSLCGAAGRTINGLCQPHYTQKWREEASKRQCIVENCDRGVKARNMCEAHYNKQRAIDKSRMSREQKEAAALELKKVLDKVSSLKLIHEIQNGSHRIGCITCVNMGIIRSLIQG